MVPIRLGDLLVKAKVINESQLQAALIEQQKWGGKLGELLVRMNFLTEDMLVKALSKQTSVPAVNLEAIVAIPPQVRSKIPMDVARDLVALPLQLRDDGKTLVVAMAEPQNIKQLDTLRAVSRCRISPQFAGRQAIARAFGRFYESKPSSEGDVESSFRLINAQGLTLVKPTENIKPGDRYPFTPGTPPVRSSPPVGRAPLPQAEPVELFSSKPPSEMVRAIEEAQRKEVNALKAMVELLIEKRVFTREEYLAKVKR